jgi:5'-phosphate synthase pdxT subunit
MSATAGVLGLQGDFEPHADMLRSLGAEPRPVRAPQDLAGLTHLVLPGGESTTLQRLLVLFGLWSEIPARWHRGELALLGTCAGAILLARDAGGAPPTLALLDADVERNAYGRQIDSFERPVAAPELGGDLRAVFIRAPRIHRTGPGVRILARDGEDPVLVEASGILAATFHPELTHDTRIHARFLGLTPRASRGGRERDPEPAAL